MHIGLTYDLRSEYLAAGYSELETAEFDRPDTIDALQNALIRLGHQVDRIGNARQLIDRLATGHRWDLVFNICEGLSGPGREAQVPAILEVYGIPCTFSDACVMSLCLQKSFTKAVVAAAGLPTPRSLLVRELRDLDHCRLNFPLFAKPVAEGTGKGVTPSSMIQDSSALFEECRRQLTEFRQPVLVEEYVAGREFTVGILGHGLETQVLGTLEIILRGGAEQGCYSYANKENCEELVEYRLVSSSDPEVREAERIAVEAWQALDGRDAGRIDLRSNSVGQPQFLEANPLAGLHPEHSDLPMIATAVGMPYTDLIHRIVSSAATRIPAPSDVGVGS
ncbi:MAG: D-alanine--D-alanine ligase [Planctomycetaceae bacterium]|nr:D-alanine--D-alanine ligase [Planctomycetaceae bacterium]